MSRDEGRPGENAITLLMPVYNARATLDAALASVFAQTRFPEQILVIDDGSTDGSAELLEAWRDRGVEVHGQANQGLAATLNRGLNLAKGQYIARLDSDDLAMPARLERQLAVMESNPGLALLGTWAEIWVGDTPSSRTHRHAANPLCVKLELLLDNPFVHSSVMFRRDVARNLGGYRENIRPYPEDFDLWSRIAEAHEVGNIPEVLTVYRELTTSITRTGASAIAQHVVDVAARNLTSVLQGAATADEGLALASLYHGKGRGELWKAARLMSFWKAAAVQIGGDPTTWTPQFRSIHDRVRRHLLGQLIRQRLPTAVVDAMRHLSNRLHSRS